MATPIYAAGLEQITSTVAMVTAQVQAEFSHLDSRQLNWQPVAGEWSIAQCLDHLIVSNRYYFPLIAAAREGNLTPTLWQRMPLLPTFFARALMAALKPNSKLRGNAPKAFLPSSSALPTTIIAQFCDHQDQLIAEIRSCAGLPLSKIVISSPAASFVTYSMLDAFRVIAGHEQHHLNQARAVKAALP